MKIIVGHADYDNIKRGYGSEVLQTTSIGAMLLGPQVEASSAFPVDNSCSICMGKGDGVTRTYCEACNGRGGRQIRGMVMEKGACTGLIHGKPWPLRFQPSFPAGLVPPPQMCRGLPADAPDGKGEGEMCCRDAHGGKQPICLGTIEYLRDEDMGGCGCHTLTMPPCSSCMSTMPECPKCGWRMEE